MPTRRGSLAQALGTAQDRAESALRSVPGESIYAAAQGRESFESADEEDIPVKVLSRAFDVAAMVPPPPRLDATTRPDPPENSEPLRVFCRLRPLQRGEKAGGLQVVDDKTVIATTQPKGGGGGVHGPQRLRAKEFAFTHVFEADAKQHEVYDRSARPLVEGLFQGRSGLLFTYGVTNAGKSYTMMGSGEAERAGLLPRALGAVLERAQATKDSVLLSFLEIYNENIYDLMDKAGGPSVAWGHQQYGGGPRRRALRLKDLGSRIEVNNLSSVRVSTIAQGLALARAAESHRKTAATGLNSTSSRSHSICQLELRSAYDNNVVLHRTPPKAQLMLVDLAGSERLERTGASGHLQKEANHINQSVSRLMHCLRVLREKQDAASASHAVVPWRDSKLTHLFQYLLSPAGNTVGASTNQQPDAARVAMIVNVSPSADDHAESLFVMANAASAKAVAIRHHPQATKASTIGCQYDHNGHRIPQQAGVKRSSDKPVSRLHRESQSEDTSSARPSSTSTATRADAQMVTELREALAVALHRVGEVEGEVRKECAEEMARTIGEIQHDYERRLRARSTFGGAARADSIEDPTASVREDDDESTWAKRRRNNDDFAHKLCRSAHKQQTRAELLAYIENLEEKFEETEAELERVRAAATHQVQQLEARITAHAPADASACEGAADIALTCAPHSKLQSFGEDDSFDEEPRRRTTKRADDTVLRNRLDAVEASAAAWHSLCHLHADRARHLGLKVQALEAEATSLKALRYLELKKLECKPIIYNDQPPPPPPNRASRSPLKENSPVVAHRSVKAAALSLDARARKIKDERLARQRAQQKHTSPVAGRTRAYRPV